MMATVVQAALTSQIQLVSRLVQLSRFAQQLVLVAGEAGSGKSSIAKSLLEQAAEVRQQAYVSAASHLSDSQIRSLLIQQCLPAAVFDADDSLVTTFTRLMPEPSRLLIVIDDANTLSAQLVSELWQLLQINRLQHLGHQLAIVLFAPTPWCQLVQRELGQSSEADAPLLLDIEPLTDEESLSLIRLFFQRADFAPKMPNTDALARHIERCLGNPAALAGYVDSLVNAPARKFALPSFGALSAFKLKLPFARSKGQDAAASSARHQATSAQPSVAPKRKTSPAQRTAATSRWRPSPLSVVVLATLLLTAAAMTWLGNRAVESETQRREVVIAPENTNDAVVAAAGASATQKTDEITLPGLLSDEPVTTELREAKDGYPGKESLAANWPKAPAQVPEGVSDSQLALEAAAQPDNQVVLDESQVSALETGQGNSQVVQVAAVATATAGNDVLSPAPVAQTSTAQPTQSAKPTAQPTPVATKAAVVTPKPQPSAKPAAATSTSAVAAATVTQLKAQPNGNYSLQILAGSELAKVQRYAQQQAIPAPYWIYPRNQQGKTLFILVQGSYSSRDAAVAAKARLPQAVQQNSPWPKSFAAIKGELN